MTNGVCDPTGIHAQQNANGDWRWLLQDGLQSVRAVANGTDVVAAQQYSPYSVPFGLLTADNDLVYQMPASFRKSPGVFA